MFVGHVAIAFVAKSIEPKISLGTGVLAALLPDLLWPVFLLAGIEHAGIKQARGAANYLASYDIAFSHSLFMDVIWAALFAAAYLWLRHYPRGAWIIFGTVLSHWLLDFVAHKPDMPLAPGAHRVFGLGLWTSVPATVIVEGGFWLLMVILYAHATRAENRNGVYAFWSVIAVLTMAWCNNIAGPPPPSLHAAAIGSLIFFSSMVAWAYWMNRLRPTRLTN